MIALFDRWPASEPSRKAPMRGYVIGTVLLAMLWFGVICLVFWLL